MFSNDSGRLEESIENVMRYRVVEYVLQTCSERHHTAWLGSPINDGGVSWVKLPNTKSVQCVLPRLQELNIALTDRTIERLTKVPTYAHLLASFQLKGIREDSCMGLLGWLSGQYPLHFLLECPTPRELLELQCRGERVATLPNANWIDGTLQVHNDAPIGRHAGAFEFLLHDLEHAHKFFGGAFRGQVRFFNLLLKALDTGIFAELCQDPRFQMDLDYLMSDMNSHPVHLLKYLKAIVLSAMKRDLRDDTDHRLSLWSTRLFEIWSLPKSVFDSAMRVNYPALESDKDRAHVSHFFQD